MVRTDWQVPVLDMSYALLLGFCTISLCLNLQFGTGGMPKDFCIQVLLHHTITYLYGMKTLESNILMLKSKPLVVQFLISRLKIVGLLAPIYLVSILQIHKTCEETWPRNFSAWFGSCKRHNMGDDKEKRWRWSAQVQATTFHHFWIECLYFLIT